MKKVLIAIGFLCINIAVVVIVQHIQQFPVAKATPPVPGTYVLPFQQPVYQTGIPRWTGLQRLYVNGSQIGPVRVDVNGDGLIDQLFQANHTGLYSYNSGTATWHQIVHLNDGKRMIEVVSCSYLTLQQYEQNCVVLPAVSLPGPQPEFLLPKYDPAYSIGITIDFSGYPQGNELLVQLVDVDGDSLPDLVYQGTNGYIYGNGSNTWSQKIWLNREQQFVPAVSCSYSNEVQYAANCEGL
jgi:hypothetical protein